DFDRVLPSVTITVCSNQALLRHPGDFTYRCFLPDLTGFVKPCRVGPNLQRHLLWADLTRAGLGREFDLATAGCEYRAPLPPRLAQPNYTDKMAERVGFEPTIELPRYTLSRRAPSTTRPSLRER